MKHSDAALTIEQVGPYVEVTVGTQTVRMTSTEAELMRTAIGEAITAASKLLPVGQKERVH